MENDFTLMALEKYITIKDVAREAGASYAVTRLALSDKCDERIRFSEKKRIHIKSVAEKLGYQANRSAKNFANKCQGAIALVTQGIYNIPQSFLNNLCINSYKKDRNLILDVFYKGQIPRCLSQNMADGIILNGDMPINILKNLDKIITPVLYLNTNHRNGKNVITYNEMGGMKLIVEMAAGENKKKITFVAGKSDHYSIKDRWESLVEESKNYKMECPEMIQYGVCSEDQESLYKHLQKNKDCDVIILSSEQYLNAISTCEKIGRKVGSDILIYVYFTEQNWLPPCGSIVRGVGINYSEAGRIVAETIGKIIKGEDVPKQILEYQLMLSTNMTNSIKDLYNENYEIAN